MVEELVLAEGAGDLCLASEFVDERWLVVDALTIYLDTGAVDGVAESFENAVIVGFDLSTPNSIKLAGNLLLLRFQIVSVHY